jgi:hypothetical protein
MFKKGRIISITLSDTLNKLSEGSFNNCFNLERVSIQDSTIKGIPTKVFHGCINLNQINLRNFISS